VATGCAVPMNHICVRRVDGSGRLLTWPPARPGCWRRPKSLATRSGRVSIEHTRRLHEPARPARPHETLCRAIASWARAAACQAQGRTAHCASKIGQALDGAGGDSSRCPLFETRRWAGQFYFDEWSEPLVIFNERHPCRLLSAYIVYYQLARTRHWIKTARTPALSSGEVIAIPQVDGLHHRRTACCLIRVGVRLQPQPPIRPRFFFLERHTRICTLHLHCFEQYRVCFIRLEI